MRILVSPNTVLDTINSVLVTSDDYDQEHLDTNILYDIHDDFEGVKWCKIYSNKKKAIQPDDLPYQTLVDTFNSKGVFFVEITESEKKLNAKTFLKRVLNVDYHKLKNEVDSEISDEKIDVPDLFSKDNKSPKNRKEIEEKNKQYIESVMKDSHRYFDFDLSDLSVKGRQDASILVEDALKVLYKNQRFYWSIIDGLNPCYTDNAAVCPTLGVSLNTIYFNTEFIPKISRKELVFILCHEALHIVLNHHSRLLHRDPILWNYAGDAIINLLLAEEFKITPTQGGSWVEFAQGGIYYPKLNLDYETTETVYDKIMKGELEDLAKQIKEKLKQKGMQMPPLGGQGGSGKGSQGQGQGQSGSGQGQSKEEKIKSILDKINKIVDKINNNVEKPENAAVKKQVQTRMNKLIPNIEKVVDIVSKKGEN